MHVAVERRGANVALIVDDDGEGVVENEAKTIFEPFYRGKREQSGETPGAGLGLAIARSIARTHGGDVALESKPTRGARFVLWLPRAAT